MSTARLTFLYPHLFRTARLGESAAAAACRRAPCRRTSTATTSASRPPQHAAPFGTAPQPQQGNRFPKRAGMAVEPKPLGDVQQAPALETPATSEAQQAAADAEERESSPEQKKEAAAKLDPAADARKETLSSPGASSSSSPDASAAEQQNTTGTPPGAPPPADGAKKKGASGPMDAILYLEPPSHSPDSRPPPHLTPPPYVHHFDSYSLVKQLSAGGYTTEQAITAMKAVRAILAQNLDVAQDSLVSKADVENETYLFRAACSELSTEVKNSRRVADEQLRQQRTLLQHEVDILAQSLNQELLTLNDTVKGMFNDRKIAVREEQKAAESAIQQLNYRISVNLTSDSRSEIEALRWVLVRRAVLGIIFMAVITLSTLRYASYLAHERQREAEKQAKEAREAEALRKSDGKQDHSSGPDAAEILAAN
ncbi:MOZ protein represents a chromatin-associated acetyltransferase [Pleurostoma richardsiae]|uniref:MOZ protein represents a chromatin-associated acetyltransferase n=1 Tax=Pleurostoma richardsiae TaxID=41990 RepID=A0AA38S292_9PEZI|nr:MOZ protein represents a chromatin-associated acetyltransferase [Pleurostoma richardsiae]